MGSPEDPSLVNNVDEIGLVHVGSCWQNCKKVCSVCASLFVILIYTNSLVPEARLFCSESAVLLAS
jgi:hypothetical protein